MKTILTFFLTIFLSQFYLQKLDANCGLELCPINRHNAGEHMMPWMVQLDYRYASFDIAGKGDYHFQMAHFMFHGERFSVGGMLPVAELNAPMSKKSGLGNIILSGEYIILPDENSLAIGSQIEFPTGDHENGIAADHYMLIPYITFTHSKAKWYSGIQAGYQAALNADHENMIMMVPLYVNPHSDSEMLYRVFTGVNLGDYSPEIYFNGRQVTDSVETGDKSFLGLGTIQRWKFNMNFSIYVRAEIQLISQKREIFNTGIGTEVKF